MSTLETTVSMIEKCTDDELNVVQQVVRQFIISRENKELSRQQFLDELETARSQHTTGEVKDARKALDELKVKYEL
jgi:hypothetical protein